MDTDDEEDEDAWRDDGEGDGLDPNEADEAGKTAADVEAAFRAGKRGKGGFKMDEVDEAEIEEYYRNRCWGSDHLHQHPLHVHPGQV